MRVDTLLAFAPLDVVHVKRCNEAEADFWKKNEGYQTRPSDELLQFDCGGQVSVSKKVIINSKAAYYGKLNNLPSLLYSIRGMIYAAMGL